MPGRYEYSTGAGKVKAARFPGLDRDFSVFISAPLVYDKGQEKKELSPYEALQ